VRFRRGFIDPRRFSGVSFRKLTVVVTMLALVFVAAVPVVAQLAEDPAVAPEPDSGTVVATGVLERQGITSYMYGTHVLTDEASGTLYALRSGVVDLDAYVGQRVTVYGTPVLGYQNGQLEGGPDLLEVITADGGSDGSADFLQYG